MGEIQRVWQANFRVYGATKVWRQPHREGIEVARCTVEGLGLLQGMRRGKTVRATVPDQSGPCPLDRVNRQFNADRQNQLLVSNFTYVSAWQGWLNVAFVTDVYARRIAGWQVSARMTTDFVFYALEHALHARQPKDASGLIHHSGRGFQYLPIRYAERLAEAGVDPSLGSHVDSYDNALAETIIGLYKAELTHRRGPRKSRQSLELATLAWVACFNEHRLMAWLGRIPPAEAKADCYHRLGERAAKAARLKLTSLRDTRGGSERSSPSWRKPLGVSD